MMVQFDELLQGRKMLQQTKQLLEDTVVQTEALGAFLVDLDGYLVARAGQCDVDDTSLSALAAASFQATSEIARLVGEHSFRSNIHHGHHRSLFLRQIGARHILIVVFDESTLLGLVKLHAEKSGDRLVAVLESANSNGGNGQTGTEPADTDSDTQTLFQSWARRM